MASYAPVVVWSPPRSLASALLLLAALVSAAPAPAQECLEVVGRWGGDRRVTRIAADGDRVVLAAGANLVVGTVAADGTIVDRGSLALQNEPLLSVAGDLAVVAFGGTRAWLVDISEPDRPRIAGRVPGLTGAAGVAISGSTVLVADYPVGLAVVDATDPAAPVVTRLPLPGAREVAFAGDLAVVVATEEHDDGSVTETLHVVDLSGPNPAVVGSCSLPSTHARLSATGRRAYVSWWEGDGPYTGAIQRIFLDDPSAPVPAPALALTFLPAGLTAADGHVLVASGEGLEVLSEDLNVVGSDPNDEAGYAVATAAGWVLVSGPSGVRSVSLVNPSRPRTVATRLNSETRLVKDVGVVGDHVVILDSPSLWVGELTLRVLDLADPSRPVEVGSLPMVSGSGLLAAADGLALVVEGHTLRVVDLAEPSQPTQVGELVFEDTPHSVAATGRLALVVDESPAVSFVDLSDPTRPEIVRSYATSSYWCEVFFDGPRAMVSERHSGAPSTLHVFDLALPSLPLVTTTSWETGSPVGAWDGLLFVAGRPRPLEVWSPEGTTPLATVATQEYAVGAAASGGWLFLDQREDFRGPPLSGYTWYIHRLSAVRIGREPNGALEGATVVTYSGCLYGGAERVRIRGDHLLIAKYDSGLMVLDAGACETLPPEARFEWWPQLPAVGQEVTFRDLSVGLPSSVRWSFPDGTTSDDPSPVHVFATPGRHAVTLEVTNHVGTDAVTMEVVVGGVRPTRGRFGRP